MIPKGISHTSVQNPTYKFQKRNISSFQENVSSIQNYQGHVILAGHFYWFGRFVPSTGIFKWTGLWCHSVSALMVQWQNTCLWCKGFWVQIQCVMFITFSCLHPWEPRFKSGFHNSFWDYVVPDRIPWMTLELYKFAQIC